MRPTVFLATVLAAASAFAGDEEKAPDWRASAADERLVAEDVERLAASKVVVAGPDLRQIFEPYIESNVPVFVTSDALLNAYHVLFEESLKRLEHARAPKLRGLLRAVWDGLPDAAERTGIPEPLAAPARRRAQVTIGVAMRLLDGRMPECDDGKVRDWIEEEAALVVDAKVRAWPEWLGPTDDRIPFLDHARFEPRGFYVADETLRRVFRATAWLEDVPFRTDRPIELASGAVIRNAIAASPEAATTYRMLVGQWIGALGDGGDLPLSLDRVSGDAAPGAWSTNSFQNAAAAARAKRRGSADTGFTSLRFLPATALPEEPLLDAATRALRGAPPAGLLVATTLGSTLAREELATSAPRVAGLAAGPGIPVDGHTLSAALLRCGATLLAPADRDAPPLFRSRAWEAKSVNTTLAAWAQWRHAWTLHAHEIAFFKGVASVRPGFVEPNPRFFESFADLVRETNAFLASQGAFGRASLRRELVAAIRRYSEWLRSGKERGSGDERADGRLAWDAIWALGWDTPSEWKNDEFEKSRPALADRLDEVAAALDRPGALPARYAALNRILTSPLASDWPELERLARRLQAMAEKQLRRAEFDAGEQSILLEFGHTLARLMQYEGNSYLDPRDDAPRATSIVAVHEPGGSRYLHVAVARPRLLYVLYPWNGAEVLCRGAVLPYREFTSVRRLTDAEWMERLDKEPPPVPDWLAIVESPAREADRKEVSETERAEWESGHRAARDREMLEYERESTCTGNLERLAKLFRDGAARGPAATCSGPSLWMAMRKDGKSIARGDESCLLCPADAATHAIASDADCKAWDDADLANPAPGLCSYAGRDLARFPLVDGAGPQVIGACLHHEGGAVVAWSDGTARFVPDAELGIAPGAERSVGPASASRVLWVLR